MIVISGALVLVALVLLVIGVVDPSLPFVYASIAVSLVSLVFLVIGILQRRGEPLPGGEAAPAPQATEAAVPAGEAVTAVVPTQSRTEAEAPVAEIVEDEPAGGGTVLVVAGRPRYHVEGCRYLAGKDAEEVDVLDAREEGFTPCGVCKPDDALAAQEPQDDVEEVDEVEDEAPVVEDVPGAVELEQEPAPARAASRRAAATKAGTSRTAAKKAPARSATAAVDPLQEVADGAGAKASTASPTRAAKAPARKAPAKAPAKAAEAAAAPAARTSGKVVVIPERGRFHRAECRYVRGVEGSELLTKAAATKQGYDACGVCKP